LQHFFVVFAAGAAVMTVQFMIISGQGHRAIHINSS